MNSSHRVVNKGKNILILVKGPTQGLVENSLTAEKMYPINFSMEAKKFCFSLHYNGANSYLFVNGKRFKAKDFETAAIPLCLGNIFKDWSTDNMTRTGFDDYVFLF